MNITINFTAVQNGKFDGILHSICVDGGEDITEDFSKFCLDRGIGLKTLEGVHSALKIYYDEFISK